MGKAPIVLLHGWGLSSASFHQLSDYLSQDFELYLVNLPGFGGSPIPEKPYGLAEMAAEVLAFIKKSGINNPTLLGHSVGGKIAAYLAATNPECVNRLILINSSGLPRTRDLKSQIKIKLIQLLRQAIKWLDSKFSTTLFKNWFIPRFASPDYKNAGPMLPTFLKVVNEQLTTLLPLIRCRTLLLWGSEDSETPLEVGERFNRAISNSELVVLTGGDHWVFAGGGATQCAYQIRKFLLA
jgi:pimeloyl-ACP methyl ester carboxylesterase